MKRNHAIPTIASITVALTLAACGGGQESTPESPDDTAGESDATSAGTDEETAGAEDEAGAEGYPEREFTIIVPYSAGGSSDGAARVLGKAMSDEMGQPVIVENREGGGAVIGVTAATRADPDGYTSLLTTVGPLTTTLFTNPDVTYTADDFAGVAGLAELPLLLITSADSDWTSIDDIRESGQDRVTYGTTGIGNTIHIANAALYEHLGMDATAVPFNSAAETLAALLGGQIDVAMAEINIATPAFEAGEVNVLAVSSQEPLPEFPDAPTLREVTGNECAVSSSFGLTVPAATPQPIVDELREYTVAARESEQFQGYLESLLMRPSDNPDGEEWIEYVISRRDILEQCHEDLLSE